ncbi:MAG: hypothetical protein DMG59_29105 [Acidobacteria bacterium]|nr:MAG: hypothetical protein DMG59_29105 [Acidobacteriota bacterium]
MGVPQQVIFVTIEPKAKSDREKLAQGLRKLVSEGSNCRINSDVRTGQTIIGGMDELQLEVIVDRLRHEFNVEATFAKPQVAYREKLTKRAEGEGRYVRQVEGCGHCAHAKIRLLPTKAGTGYVFESQVGNDIIPEGFVKSIDAGIKDALTRGVLAGYPIDDVSVELYDGSFHEVDSSDMAFRIAGSMAFQDAAKRAGPVVLEAIMAVEVVVPEQYMGDLIADLNSRRGRIESMQLRGTTEIIKSSVPLSEMFSYATFLRSQTLRGTSYSMHFDRYEPLPGGPHHEDDDGMAPVVAPRTPAPRGKSSSVSLPEPDN